MIRMTKAEKEQARRDYLADPSATYRRLAAEYGVSEGAMQRALAPVSRRPGGVVRASLSTEQMWRMWRVDGLTLAEIGRQAGITESGVSRRLAKYEGQVDHDDQREPGGSVYRYDRHAGGEAVAR